MDPSLPSSRDNQLKARIIALRDEAQARSTRTASQEARLLAIGRVRACNDILAMLRDDLPARKMSGRVCQQYKGEG